MFWKIVVPNVLVKSLRNTWDRVYFLNTHIVRAFSSSLLGAIIAHNHQPFFKICSNFVHFCANFQIFCPFLPFFNIFCPFLSFSCKIARMSLPSRIDPYCMWATEAFLEPHQTSKMKLFSKSIDYKSFTIFTNSSILVVWQGYNYGSGLGT